MDTIGFVVAMPEEIRPLLHHAKRWRRFAFGKFPGFRFELAGRDCLLVKSGIGLEHAIQATHALLVEVQPELLVSFGVGGGVESDLHVGDVVLGKVSCQLKTQALVSFRPLVPLGDQVREAIVRVLQPRGATVVWGTIVTTPGSPTIQPRPEIDHPVLDMETAGVAQVAADMDIPLLAMRALSDTPQDPIPFDIEAFTSGSWNTRLVRITGTILRHPGILFQLVRLGRNTEKAAQNAALALVTALNHSLPELDDAG